jgi:hypothetical protein
MTEITEEDVRSLIEAWFEAVADKLPLEEQRRFFSPGVVIDTWAGVKVPLEAQIALHDTLTDEGHLVNSLDVERLADGRVRAIADVTWEATRISDGGRIVADAGEDWTIERGPDGRCRFASYLTSSMRYRPGSAELDL